MAYGPASPAVSADEIVDFSDIAPTFIALARLPPAPRPPRGGIAGGRGRSFASLLYPEPALLSAADPAAADSAAADPAIVAAAPAVGPLRQRKVIYSQYVYWPGRDERVVRNQRCVYRDRRELVGGRCSHPPKMVLESPPATTTHSTHTRIHTLARARVRAYAPPNHPSLPQPPQPPQNRKHRNEPPLSHAPL